MATLPITTLTEEQAVKLALEIERTEAALKQMKASIKEFVDSHGALRAGDRMWDYSTTVSWDFDAQRLRELALNITVEGRNPWEFLTLPASAIKKLGWDESALLQYGTKKEGRRFDSKKA